MYMYITYFVGSIALNVSFDGTPVEIVYKHWHMGVGLSFDMEYILYI